MTLKHSQVRVFFIISEFRARQMNGIDNVKCTFAADNGQEIRLICIPKFSETSTGVLVDLNDLNASPISFTID